MPSTRRRSRAAAPTTPVREVAVVAAAVAVEDRLAVPEAARPNASADRIPSETLVWIGIAVLAIGARALNLDGAPLSASESGLALDSWNIVQRTGLDLGGHPLLTYANALAFLVLGATDATARVVPLFAGVMIALSPLAFRNRLGLIATAVAGIALATSPTLIFASRTVDSTSLAVVFAVGIVAAWCRWLERPRRPAFLYLSVALLVGLLTSGPAAVPIVAIFVVYALSQAGRLNAAVPSTSPAEPSDVDSLGLVDRWPVVGLGRPALARLAIFGVVLYSVVATGFGTNLTGLGDALAEPIGGWLAAIGPSALPLLALVLLAYEPLIAIFGIAGIVHALRGGRRDPFDIFLVYWAIAGLALGAVSGAGHPIWFSIALVPLALLAGRAVEVMVPAILDGSYRLPLALFAILGLSFCFTLFIALGNVTLPEPNVPTSVLAAPVLAIAILVTSFAYRYGWPLTGVATAATGFILLLVLSFHAAMLLNPGGALNPAEAFVGTGTSPDARTLASDVSTVLSELHIARQLEGLSVSESVEVMQPFDEPMAWYLRQWSQTTSVASIDDAPGLAIESAQAKPPRGAYAGETFQISSSAPLPSLDFNQIARWWLYREPPSATSTFVRAFVKTQLARQQ
jgi:uncharacterized protein (TIGR03663 family)